MKYAVVTFGCRVNQADSLTLEGELLARGASPSDTEHADIVIVNTCSVTATADQGARQTIRRIARHNPRVRIVVTGCYATREPDAVSSLPNVVQVVSNRQKDDLLRVIGSDLRDGEAGRYADGEGPCGAALMPGVGGRTALLLRVQTGCDEACSYCIIPRTRGTGRSRPLAEVIESVGRAVDAGYKEIVITGVHLGSYGHDLANGTSLLALAGALSEWKGDVLFRLSSLEPMDCTRELVALVRSSSRLAPHFHLPLQHGSDEVLRAMRRPYTVAYYRRLVDDIAASMPHASIGTDVMVGFPGESTEHFDEMRTLLEHLPLHYLHVFPYSDRPGTEASQMGNRVDAAVVRERGRQLRAIGEAKTRHFRAQQAGSIRRALTVDDGWSAVTDNYLRVRLDRQHPRNQWVEAPL